MPQDHGNIEIKDLEAKIKSVSCFSFHRGHISIMPWSMVFISVVCVSANNRIYDIQNSCECISFSFTRHVF
jgi:hypothetical protein